MIIRILGEGQWELDQAHVDGLNELDREVERAIETGDERSFAGGLARLLDRVRVEGSRLADESLVDSDLILPPSDATLEEVRELLTDEGLVPD